MNKYRRTTKDTSEVRENLNFRYRDAVHDTKVLEKAAALDEEIQTKPDILIETLQKDLININYKLSIISRLKKLESPLKKRQKYVTSTLEKLNSLVNFSTESTVKNVDIEIEKEQIIEDRIQDFNVS